MDEIKKLKEQITLLKEEIEFLEETNKEAYKLKSINKNLREACNRYMGIAENHSITIRRMMRERSKKF